MRLAEDLLEDIELRRIEPVDIARKTGRLARLLDDQVALRWLRYEIAGYPNPLDAEASEAALFSNRQAPQDDQGGARFWTGHLASLAAEADGARVQLSSGDEGTSSSEWAITVEREKAQRRDGLRSVVSGRNELIERITSSFYSYVSVRYQELRFGSAVESAFDVVRAQVDETISTLVPDALPKLSAAFENVTSENPEHWANAASTCRRLLKAAADALRPPGPDKDGRRMDDGAYINRLVDWIVAQSASRTAGEMISSDLEYLGHRLDAADDAGHKGAHAEVDRFDASRFLVGTYLVLGDILRLRMVGHGDHA